MERRTDLALEIREQHSDCAGVSCRERESGSVTVTEMSIDTPHAARELRRPEGIYITVTLQPLTDNAVFTEDIYRSISGPLAEMLPPTGTVLVAGLGNLSVTPDALGPKAVSMIPATRHIIGEMERSMGCAGLRSCAVIAPGVLGQTGVEAAALISAVCREVKPSAVVVIDALASRSLDRLGRTVQLCDTGIQPGAGVGNCRPAISCDLLGVPVIALGVPTVVDAVSLAYDLTGGNISALKPGGRSMIVTPREIDLLIDRAARLLALAVNHALHPDIDPEELIAL